jgi:hypothetical protein
LTSHEPTMFWILKSVNWALNPSFWIMRAYLRDASFESSSDLAPVTTILPEAKIKAVVFGSRIRIITAAKRFGLYSAFLACNLQKVSTGCQYQQTHSTDAMVFKSKRQFKLTVATKFCRVGTMPLTPFALAAPGVAAGVAGATPTGGCSFCTPFAPLPCGADPSDGGVRSLAAVGYDSEPAMKTVLVKSETKASRPSEAYAT